MMQQRQKKLNGKNIGKYAFSNYVLLENFRNLCFSKLQARKISKHELPLQHVFYFSNVIYFLTRFTRLGRYRFSQKVIAVKFFCLSSQKKKKKKILARNYSSFYQYYNTLCSDFEKYFIVQKEKYAIQLRSSE